MEVTGYDSVLVLAPFELDAVTRFLRKLAALWPALRISIAQSDGLVDAGGLDDLSLPDRRGDLGIARDGEMGEHFAEHGFALLPDGEGSVAIIYERFDTLDWMLTFGRDLSPDAARHQPDPYPALLLARDAAIVTLITPADPTREAFSRKIFDLLVDAIGMHTP